MVYTATLREKPQLLQPEYISLLVKFPERSEHQYLFFRRKISRLHQCNIPKTILRWLSSGLYSHVDWCKFISVSEVLTASIIRETHRPEDLWNADKPIPVYTALQLTRQPFSYSPQWGQSVATKGDIIARVIEHKCLDCLHTPRTGTEEVAVEYGELSFAASSVTSGITAGFN
jgi:hypothetical protein